MATYKLNRKAFHVQELKGFFRQVFYDKYQYILTGKETVTPVTERLMPEYLLVRKNAYRGALVSIFHESDCIRLTTTPVIPGGVVRALQKYLGLPGKLLFALAYGDVMELLEDVDHLINNHVFADKVPAPVTLVR